MQNLTVCRLYAFLTAAVFLLCGIVFPKPEILRADAFSSSDYADDYADFLYALGESESNNRYDATNGQYLGYWQMGNLALQEVGFLDSSNEWTELAASFGITDKESFLASEEGQEYAVLKYHKRIYQYTKSMGVVEYVDTEVSGVNMTFAGMIVAAHALGVGGLKKLIVNGTSGSTANDATALRYMEKYGVYDIKTTITGEMPSYTTVTTTAATTTTSATTTTTATSATTVSTTFTTTVTTSATTASTTALNVPSYIDITFSDDVAVKGEVFYIYAKSDTAEQYHVLMTAPSGTEIQYIFSGNMLGVVLQETGVYQIIVTASNSAGSSTTETLYVAVQDKTVVSDENRGDANTDGSVDIADASVILQYYASAAAGMLFPSDSGFNRSYADVNEDDAIDIADASLVLRYYASKMAGISITWDDII